MAKFTLHYVSGLATYDLPPSFTREIGRILVRWAYFEYSVQSLCWDAADLSPAAGRIAMREPRVTDRLEMLNELVSLRGATWDSQLYKSILSRARLAAAKRDLISHGIWAHLDESGQWNVQLARGSWPKDLAELELGSKKVNPESVHMDLAKLMSATSDIDALIRDLHTLRDSADLPPEPSPSPEKPS